MFPRICLLIGRATITNKISLAHQRDHAGSLVTNPRFQTGFILCPQHIARPTQPSLPMLLFHMFSLVSRPLTGRDTLLTGYQHIIGLTSFVRFSGNEANRLWSKRSRPAPATLDHI